MASLDGGGVGKENVVDASSNRTTGDFWNVVPAESSQSLPKKSKKSKRKLNYYPSAPKRPPTAFDLFSAEERPKIEESLGALYEATEVAVQLGRRWGALDQQVKHEFTQFFCLGKKLLHKNENHSFLF